MPVRFFNNKQGTKGIRGFFWFFVLLASPAVYGQWQISGAVTKDLKPVSGVSLIVARISTKAIVAFSTSGKDGRYAVSVSSGFEPDSFYIQVNTAGYARQPKPIHSLSDRFDFALTEEATPLPQVIVKSAPRAIRAQGDTINYQVKEFVRPTDRTIGDVIKRLPGVEMDQQGKITYQGKPLNRFYIDGDNLLDDKYNIATHAVPADMISTIQVLDKHQPVRALENIQYSDAPAMNIITTEGARTKLVGEGNAAAGTPGLYDATLNALLLKKKIKFINFLKFNNAANDLSTEIISHNFSDNASKIGYQPVRNLVGSNFISPPAIGKKRYLINNSFLPSVNNLVNIGKNATVRINSYYFVEKQYQSFDKKVVTYLPGQELLYTEKQDGRAASNTFRTQVNINVNDSSYYLNNSLALENVNTNNTANTIAAYSIPPYIAQAHTGSYTGLSNELSLIKKFRNGRNVIEFFSYVEHNTSPQQLAITPGLYDAMLNNGTSYARLTQQVALPGTFTTNYLTYRRVLGQLAWISKVGMSYQQQEVQSTLSLLQNNGATRFEGDSFVNHTAWRRTMVFIQQGLEWKRERWHLQVTLPLNFQQTSLGDPVHPGSDTAVRLTPLNPSVVLNMLSGKQNSIQLSAYMDKRVGTIENAYQGAIFNSYRNTTKHSAALPLQTSKGVAVNYYFKRALEGFFVNAGLTYVRNRANTIENIFVSNAIQQSDFLYVNNPVTFASVSGSASKYFYKKNTTLKIGFSQSWQTFRQLQNGLTIESRVASTVYKLRIDSRFTDRVLFDYTANFNNTKIYQELLPGKGRTEAAQLYLMNHELNVNLLFGKIMYVACSFEDFWNKIPGNAPSNYLFFDVKPTIRFPNMRSDIQLAALNLLDNRSFRTRYISGNVLSDSRYTIRPRSFMVKFSYRF